MESITCILTKKRFVVGYFDKVTSYTTHTNPNQDKESYIKMFLPGLRCHPLMNLHAGARSLFAMLSTSTAGRPGAHGSFRGDGEPVARDTSDI